MCGLDGAYTAGKESAKEEIVDIIKEFEKKKDYYSVTSLIDELVEKIEKEI